MGYYNSLFNFSFEEKLKNTIKETKPVIFLLGQDEINMEVLNDAFVVYLGHHGDQGASVANIILPAPAYTEKTSTYVNTEGRVLQTSKCYSPLGEAKEEWKIFRALSDSFGSILKFNNLQELREKLLSGHPMFSKLFEKPFGNKISFGSKDSIKDKDINYNIENFYMTDAISRASETMAICTKEILNKIS